MWGSWEGWREGKMWSGYIVREKILFSIIIITINKIINKRKKTEGIDGVQHEIVNHIHIKRV